MPNSLDPPPAAPGPRRRGLCAGAAGLLLGTGVPPVLAQDRRRAAPSATDKALKSLVDSPTRPLASLAALAVRDGAVVYEAAFGQRDVDRGLPATPDTFYRIASISKFVTAIGVMTLVEAGELDLDADLGRHFGSALRNPSFPDQAVSARMLLSHTSSLRDAGDVFPARVGLALEDALQTGVDAGKPSPHWASQPEQAPARRWFSYANLNFTVLGTLVERVSGQRFDRFMAQRVFAPLGLRASFNPAEGFTPAEREQLATLYRKSPDQGRTWQPRGPWVAQGPDRTGPGPTPIAGLADYAVGSHAGIFGPQGGLRISLRGLGTLMRLMIGQGSVDGMQLLRPATVQAMLAPQWSFNGKPGEPNGDTDHGLYFAWGLGIQRFTGRSGPPGRGDRIGSPTGGLRGAGHLGDAYGLLSGLVFDPAARRGMAYILGGTSADPGAYRGRFSALSGWEEAVLGALWRHALSGS